MQRVLYPISFISIIWAEYESDALNLCKICRTERLVFIQPVHRYEVQHVAVITCIRKKRVNGLWGTNIILIRFSQSFYDFVGRGSFGDFRYLADPFRQ